MTLPSLFAGLFTKNQLGYAPNGSTTTATSSSNGRVVIVFFKKRKPEPTWLEGYRVYAAPHIGRGRDLSAGQAQENLGYLLENKSDRVGALAGLVTQFDIDLLSGMAADSYDSVVTELYQWAGERWPDYYDEKRNTRRHGSETDRSGDDVVYSMLIDVGIVLGELIIKHRPTYAWALDLDPGNREMATWQRCVIAAPSVAFPVMMAICDVEDLALARFDNTKVLDSGNTWLRVIGDYVSGAHEGAHLR